MLRNTSKDHRKNILPCHWFLLVTTALFVLGVLPGQFEARTREKSVMVAESG